MRLRHSSAAEREFILHIGLRKSGSSYLQTLLARNLARLRNHGVAYPELGEMERARRSETTSGNGHPLAVALLSRETGDPSPHLT